MRKFRIDYEVTTVQERFEHIVSHISLPEAYSIRIGRFDEGAERYFLQLMCDGTCNVTGRPAKWGGAKFALSQHMVDGEVVQTALKAFLTALEHEAREVFKYKGVSIFDPHYDLEKLVELRRQADSVKGRH